MVGWSGTAALAAAVLSAASSTGAPRAVGPVPPRHVAAFERACVEKDTPAQCRCLIADFGRTREGRLNLT